MYETDNFAYIIGEIERRKEEIRLRHQQWKEWDEAKRRETPWCWAIGITFVAGLAIYFYFNP